MFKKILTVTIALGFSVLIVYGLPKIYDQSRLIDANINNEVSLVKQGVVSYGKSENNYKKIYANGSLIGVVSDYEYLMSLIDLKYKDYEKDFPNTTLGLTDDVYVVDEKSYVCFENVDDQIMNFLVDNDLLGVKTTAIEFSTASGVYDRIYVKNIDDFYNARDEFLLNFISEDTLKKLRASEPIDSPKELGTVERALNINETIKTSEAIVSPEDIFSNVSDIYTFLCYGRDDYREYYTVKEGDTLQGVGYYFGDMSPKQIVMLNPDVLTNENQVITPGMKLNVTYYKSPITVQVTKQNLSQQYITPETPEYIEDEELESGVVEIEVEEESGIKNVLYKETWINGVLSTGELESETIIKRPKRGVIRVGTKQVIMVGTGNFIMPCDNPRITCHWGCYENHTGTDFVNKYEKYTNIYAMDSGVVESIGYAYDMGNYCIINHQNGFRTMYMHLNVPPYVDEGSNIVRGQVLGQMGNTGRSDGVHVHIVFEVDGERVNSCRYLPCELAQ